MKYVKYVDPAAKTKQGQFGDSRDNFVSPTLLNVLRIVKIDMKAIPSEMCYQLGVAQVRENFEWNKTAWPPNRKAFRLNHMSPEGFKK